MHEILKIGAIMAIHIHVHVYLYSNATPQLNTNRIASEST